MTESKLRPTRGHERITQRFERPLFSRLPPVRSGVTEPALALAAGVVSFLSPCMLPVIPAFLAQLAGKSLGTADLKRRDVLLDTVLFVIGFSTVFAVLGVLLNAVL